MDKIWYRNPSKSAVIGRCGGNEKTNDHAERTKVEQKQFFLVINASVLFLLFRTISQTIL